MGQFYKTSNPEFLDFMYKVPWDLAKEVMQHQDKKIDDEIAKTANLQKLLDFNYIKEVDTAEANRVKTDYLNQIRDITDSLQKDPESFLKHSNTLRDLSTKLQNDYTSGRIASMINSYNDYEEFKKKNSNVKSRDNYEGMKEYLLADALKKRTDEGYDNTGGQSVFKNERVLEHIDVAKGFLPFLNAMGINSTSSTSSNAIGGYIYKRVNSNKELTKAEVQKLYSDYVQTIPGIEAYVTQQSKLKPYEEVMKKIGANGLELASNYAFSQKASGMTMSSDGTYLYNDKQRREEEKELRDKDPNLGGSVRVDNLITLGREFVPKDAKGNPVEGPARNGVLSYFNYKNKYGLPQLRTLMNAGPLMTRDIHTGANLTTQYKVVRSDNYSKYKAQEILQAYGQTDPNSVLYQLLNSDQGVTTTVTGHQLRDILGIGVNNNIRKFSDGADTIDAAGNKVTPEIITDAISFKSAGIITGPDGKDYNILKFSLPVTPNDIYGEKMHYTIRIPVNGDYEVTSHNARPLGGGSKKKR